MATQASRETPSTEQFHKWFDELSNWGRWGKDELMGTLNLITPEKRRQAAALVTEGISVSCSMPIRFFEHNLDDAWAEPRRFTSTFGDIHSPDFLGRGASSDVVVLNTHGLTLSHLDAPGHTFFKPSMDRPMTLFNGVLASEAVSSRDIVKGDITLVADGVVSRGVLLDIARLQGVDWLEPRTKIFPEDLEAAEKAQGVKVEPGDILCIRSGHPMRKRAEGWNSRPSEQAGPDGACLPWLKERDVALLACDTANDVFPADEGKMVRPVHSIGMAALGLWLLDGADYEDLAVQCARLNRWEFQMVIPPLRLNNASASPVNPIAIL